MKRPGRGAAIYLLPNLLTTGNLIFGFFSMIKALQGQFAWAASAILLAAIFDVLDGRVARLTNTTSEFGVQYDSLCDLISFGLAPALLMYQFGLATYKHGWILCLLFVACGALRLARFNVQSSIGKASGDFTGLPIPMAALTVAFFVLFLTDLDKTSGGEYELTQWLYQFLGDQKIRAYTMMVAAPALALAMVSNIAYRSHKVIKFHRIRPFSLLTTFVFMVGVALVAPEGFGFFVITLYALSGPFERILGWKKPVEEDEIFTPHGDDQSIMEPSEETDSADGTDSIVRRFSRKDKNK